MKKPSFGQRGQSGEVSRHSGAWASRPPTEPALSHTPGHLSLEDDTASRPHRVPQARFFILTRRSPWPGRSKEAGLADPCVPLHRNGRVHRGPLTRPWQQQGAGRVARRPPVSGGRTPGGRQAAASIRAKRKDAGPGGRGSHHVTLVLKGLGALSPRQWKETPNCFLLLRRRERK